MPINTTTLPNGAHTLKVTVVDAAQDASVVYDGPISTLQPSDGSLGTLLGLGAGGAASLEHERGRGERGRAPRARPARAASRSFAKRELRVSGRLLNAQGEPIGGAALEVLQQVAARTAGG